MRKLTYLVAVTADGLIAREDGSCDFFPMAGEHLRYLAQEYPETFPGHLRASLDATGSNRHFDTVLMGRRTYEVGLAAKITSPYRIFSSTCSRARCATAANLLSE